MFITINRKGHRYENQESTINLNQIIEFRVYRTSETKEYVTIFMTNGHIDITLEQYKAIMQIIAEHVIIKVNVPIS